VLFLKHISAGVRWHTQSLPLTSLLSQSVISPSRHQLRSAYKFIQIKLYPDIVFFYIGTPSQVGRINSSSDVIQIIIPYTLD